LIAHEAFMTNALLIAILVLLVVAVVLQVLLLLKKVDFSSIHQTLQGLDKSYERAESVVREEIGKNRQEGSKESREARQELADTLNSMGTNLNQQILTLTTSNDQKLEQMRGTIEQRLQSIQADNAKKLDETRIESAAAAQKAREEVTLALKNFSEATVNALKDMGTAQQTQLGNVVQQLTKLTEAMEKKLDGLKTAVEERLKAIQQDNTKQLDQMRATVDEKLQGTLEKRLGESFKQVSDRLEQVHKGLGEMQTLASGVGDLKRVLTNVKTRGTWGEVQLGAMLEQVLSPEQYATNVPTKAGGERVEFAIKLPGRGEDTADVIWLPIDAKFPLEDYQRLVEAQERIDPAAAEAASKQLETRIKQCAKVICDKYIGPPKTTDFGILFLPNEGLFAEAVRRVGLADYVQRECRVVLAGPTTLWSILNSLQMGFRTLAIEKRSSEVWKVLGAVKTEFGKFGELLDGVKRKLDQASDNIEDAARKSRTIERKLRGVQELPAAEAAAMLPVEALGAGNGEHDEDNLADLPGLK
jgi:DNA recombination protein RmuC